MGYGGIRLRFDTARQGGLPHYNVKNITRKIWKMTSNKNHRPPRLSTVFQKYDLPLYFVTLCVLKREKLLANKDVMNTFEIYVERGYKEHGIAVGRYVLMPDHIHLFVRCPVGMKLGRWIHGLKYAISKVIKQKHPNIIRIWQDGFFDHLLRNDESYAEKWKYVLMNPVRQGLVKNAEDWKYSGELVVIDRV